ncbi:MAG: hypothetical protein EBZ47_01305 [Chlamydiae bacterium]|nr:hypothetical protein [Chlamydiota bacterium]
MSFDSCYKAYGFYTPVQSTFVYTGECSICAKANVDNFSLHQVDLEVYESDIHGSIESNHPLQGIYKETEFLRLIDDKIQTVTEKIFHQVAEEDGLFHIFTPMHAACSECIKTMKKIEPFRCHICREVISMEKNTKKKIHSSSFTAISTPVNITHSVPRVTMRASVSDDLDFRNLSRGQRKSLTNRYASEVKNWDFTDISEETLSNSSLDQSFSSVSESSDFFAPSYRTHSVSMDSLLSIAKRKKGRNKSFFNALDESKSDTLTRSSSSASYSRYISISPVCPEMEENHAFAQSFIDQLEVHKEKIRVLVELGLDLKTFYQAKIWLFEILSSFDVFQSKEYKNSIEAIPPTTPLSFLYMKSLELLIQAKDAGEAVANNGVMEEWSLLSKEDQALFIKISAHFSSANINNYEHTIYKTVSTLISYKLCQLNEEKLASIISLTSLDFPNFLLIANLL